MIQKKMKSCAGRTHLKKKLASACSLVSLTLVSGAVFAEEDEAAPIEEIVVSGVKGSLKRAIDLKRNSVNVVDGIVAEDIANFPDLNLGEALQRVTGVTVERQDGGSRSTAVGEGSTINVRGLGASFTRTEINGMTGTNTGQDRGFGFNLLASELFTQAQVTKTLSASDNEGGLAGTVKLETYKPFDYDERLLSINLNAAYTEQASDTDLTFSVVYANQFADGKFGVSAALAINNTHRREDIADASNWDFLRDSLRGNFDLLTPEEQAALGDLQIPRDPRIVSNDRENERFNTAVTFQLAASDDLTFTLDNIVANIDNTGDQLRQDFPIEGFPGTFIPTDLVREGDRFVSGTFPAASHFARVLAYDYDIQEELRQHVLGAEWVALDSITVESRLGYSTSEQDIRKWNVHDFRSDPTDIFYQVQGDFVTFDVAIGNPSDLSLFTNLRDIRNRPQISQDEEVSFTTDVSYSFESDIFSSLDFGVRYAEREKSFRTFDGRADRNVIRNLGLSLADFGTVREFNVDGSPAGYPTTILGVDFDAIRQATTPNGFDIPERLGARYQVNEDTLALYTQLNFETDKLAGNLGLRYAQTDVTSAGLDTDGSGNFTPTSVESDYNEVLPSLNIRYNLSDDVIARLGIYKSLTRPDLVDIQPGINFGNFSGASGTLGNPALQPFTSDNFDLSAEWYFSDEGVISAAFFRKDLDGFIERVVSEEQLTDPFTGDLLTINLSRPINGEDATIDGFEFSIQSPFTFLPEWGQNFGGVFNYTTTDSEANFGGGNDIRNESLPFISDFSYNAILYYEDDQLSVRAAYNFRDDYLLAVSGSGGQPVYRDDYGQLDLSASYTVNENLRLKLDVINALGDQIRSYSNNDPLQIKGLIETGYQVVFGVSYNL